MSTKFLFIMFFTLYTWTLMAQESVNIPERTPEQEATRQTERLQRELELSPEQIKEVYDINLHYARQRQISNSRNEAMERIKNKNTDLKRVLNTEQYTKLQNKHYDRSTYKIPTEHYSSGELPETQSNRKPVETKSPEPDLRSSELNQGTGNERTYSSENINSRSSSNVESVRPSSQTGTREEQTSRQPSTSRSSAQPTVPSTGTRSSSSRSYSPSTQRPVTQRPEQNRSSGNTSSSRPAPPPQNTNRSSGSRSSGYSTPSQNSSSSRPSSSGNSGSSRSSSRSSNSSQRR